MSAGCLCGSHADGFPKWPVRNGDFMLSQGWGFPTDWSPATNSGKLNFTMDPLGQNLGTAISTAMIETIEPGSGYYYQTVYLLKGKHRVSCEVSGTDGAQAQVTLASGKDRFSSDLATVGSDWKLLQFDIQVQTGDASLAILSQAIAGQRVKFRNMKIEAVSLDSSMVPVEGGASMGGIVIPEKPTLAEQYAAYELQKYITKMTGHIPGLKGRDKTFAGTLIYVGRAAASQLPKLAKMQQDSYLVAFQGNSLSLAGKADNSTLYAIYDYLSQQGCRWVIPGSIGEVVPERKTLLKAKSKIESPDYECRGTMVMTQEFNPGGGEEFGWISINIEDYYDWFIRNRMNAIWYAGSESYDFGCYGEHRGHSWVQMTGHSFGTVIAPAATYFKDHPDWYPLINGKREPMCKLPPFFPNQLCVSNKGLRDYTVNLALDYFKNNPAARAFPMNVMDGPSLWCECDECKKLDPPGIDWSKHESEGAVSGMTDRVINYANEVADRVAKVYPGKLIEVYGYGYTLAPPVREKVSKNVFIKYANLSGGRGTGPLGPSIMDPTNPIWTQWRKTLDGWKSAGAKLGYYNYLEWEHQDVSLFWFSNSNDVLRNLNRHYNCRILMGETENNILMSPMLYNIIARTVWDVDTDYHAVIKDLCKRFYGSVGDTVYQFNMMMDDATVKSEAWKVDGWCPNKQIDIPLATLEAGRVMLDEAAEKVKDDKIISQRLAYVRFGLAYLTYVDAQNQPKKTTATAAIARKAFDQANALRSEFYIRVKYVSVQQLKTFYYPPVFDEQSIVLPLPDMWQFKTDPNDKGLAEKWFASQPDETWKPISVSKDWTSQEPGKGYHGVAWYHTSFTMPAEAGKGSSLAIHFGAVDGYVDVYLDGAKIGEQKKDVGFMWEKPFEIALPADLDSTKPHSLVLRVSKDIYAAGVWQPVSIARMTPEATKEVQAQGRVNW